MRYLFEIFDCPVFIRSESILDDNEIKIVNFQFLKYLDNLGVRPSFMIDSNLTVFLVRKLSNIWLNIEFITMIYFLLFILSNPMIDFANVWISLLDWHVNPTPCLLRGHTILRP